MLAAQTDDVDRALWTALRTLEERAALAHKLAERGRERRQSWVDKAFTERAQEAEREAEHIRTLLRVRGGHIHTIPDDVANTAVGPGEPDKRGAD
jgi:two-component system chemotaxis response regulator CheB